MFMLGSKARVGASIVDVNPIGHVGIDSNGSFDASRQLLSQITHEYDTEMVV